MKVGGIKAADSYKLHFSVSFYAFFFVSDSSLINLSSEQVSCSGSVTWVMFSMCFIEWLCESSAQTQAVGALCLVCRVCPLTSCQLDCEVLFFLNPLRRDFLICLALTKSLHNVMVQTFNDVWAMHAMFLITWRNNFITLLCKLLVSLFLVLHNFHRTQFWI